ncbi:MAG TPA: ABC transporter ATP-binding protein [Stellaceae bacterium]|nr:ABC transporter ATP-binding protein [Stellaceae bacterium]
MPDLVLRHVTKLFGDTVAVDDLSLSIGDGEFVCLLGPSGCGKTTTLRMIGGFETVDHGTILLDGADITAMPPQKRDIGLVFQHYALFPHMTVAQNVGYGLKMRRYAPSRIAAEVGEALDLVRLGDLAARYPSQLSGGQQQRVALARALAIRPRLLLMDEPLSNLDAKLRDDMRVEIRRIQKRVGITTIFVTHDQVEAFALADRIGVMTKGRLRQMANPAALYETPANATVGSFIGQVNSLTGRVRAFEGERVRIDVEDGLAIIGMGRDLRLGAAATSIVKQERVLLSRQSPAGTENVFPCRIEATTYLGGHINYVCLVQSQVVNAIVPSHSAFERFEPGETVFASWSTADCHIFAA